MKIRVNSQRPRRSGAPKRAPCRRFRLPELHDLSVEDKLSPLCSRPRPQLDDAVGGGDQGKAVLAEKHAMARFDEGLEEHKQALLIGDVESESGLVEEVETRQGCGLSAEVSQDCQTTRFAGGEAVAAAS